MCLKVQKCIWPWWPFLSSQNIMFHEKCYFQIGHFHWEVPSILTVAWHLLSIPHLSKTGLAPSDSLTIGKPCLLVKLALISLKNTTHISRVWQCRTELYLVPSHLNTVWKLTLSSTTPPPPTSHIKYTYSTSCRCGSAWPLGSFQWMKKCPRTAHSWEG